MTAQSAAIGHPGGRAARRCSYNGRGICTTTLQVAPAQLTPPAPPLRYGL